MIRLRTDMRLDLRGKVWHTSAMKRKEKTLLPESFRPYFWDVRFEDLDAGTHSHLIIKRVLDRGNLSDIRWLIKTYGENAIREVVLTTRDLSRPTANFWADILGIDKAKVPCLQTPYSPIHFGLSS